VVRVVAAVAGLGQGVGTEGGELLRREELLDGRGHFFVARGEVEVVHDLAALVAEELEVLEAGRSAHVDDDSCPS
jgi:hypothetical protein